MKKIVSSVSQQEVVPCREKLVEQVEVGYPESRETRILNTIISSFFWS